MYPTEHQTNHFLIGLSDFVIKEFQFSNEVKLSIYMFENLVQLRDIDIKTNRLILVVAKPHDFSENICLLKFRYTTLSKQRFFDFRDILKRFNVGI